jgi:hypothetical protein
MDMSVGTFNLNNLFSRFNFYTEASEDESTPEPEADPAPRHWLSAPDTDSERAALSDDTGEPAVEVLSRGEVGADGRVHWERRFKGKLILGKDADAQRILARRIPELRVDVLAVQEVEDLPTNDATRRAVAGRFRAGRVDQRRGAG